VPVSEGQENIFTSNLDTASTTNPVINLEPLDTTPPAVTINSPKEKQYLHSDIIPVDYQITDESATKETLYFDSVLFEENQIDGFFQELGIHQLKIDALDKFNNSSTVTFEIIATLDSLYRDIGRAYSLGWIKNTRTRDTALNLVNNVRNWYNKYELLKQTNPVMAKLVKTKLISLLATLKTSLNLFEKLRVITHQANQLIFKQIEYIINNL